MKLLFSFIVVCVALATWSARAATNYNVTAIGQSAYVINGVNNPTLTLTRGQTYAFNLNAPNHPFWITTAPDAATSAANAFSSGVTNNGVETATVTFVVPADAPATLFYQCEYHDPMGGVLNIVPPTKPVPALAPMWMAAMAAVVVGVASWSLHRRRQRGAGPVV